MMMVEILLAFPALKSEQMTLLWETLSNELSDKGLHVSIKPATTRDKVLDSLTKSGVSPSLIISHMQLPASDKSGPDPWGGLALVRELRRRGLKSPVILVSDIVDKEIQVALDRLPSCRLVIEGALDWETNLLGRCREELGSVGKGEAKPALEQKGKIDVFLNIEQTPQGHYHMHAPGYSTPDKPLKLDAFVMKDLARRSKHVRTLEDEEWEEEFHAIGIYLLRELFIQNFDFHSDFKEMLHRTGGEENVRLRFIVEKETHPIALEALLDEQDDFFMLHAPVYRMVQVTGVKAPLFDDDWEAAQPVRCLIIQANTCGIVPDIQGADGDELKLNNLSNASKEGAFLSRFLKGKAATFPIEKVKRLGDHHQPATLERVRRILTKEGPWHLVHFAGHSHYDERHDAGYVFLPGKTGPQPLLVDDFARYLRSADTRFVYLSSCQSSAADFAFSLATRSIPAIVGFRWDIDDDKAAKHAEIFYRQLFEGSRKLEYAFLETRKKMHENFRDNRIWAAALLIIQVEKQ